MNRTDRLLAIVLELQAKKQIRAEDLAAPLAQLQYDALKRDFEIVNTSLSSQTITRNRREIKTEVMELALYPLHIGRITLPILEFAGKKSQPLSLNVLESSPAVPRVLFETGILPAQAMQRQEIYLYLDVYHDGSLLWRKPPQIKAVGSSVRALPSWKNGAFAQTPRSVGVSMPVSVAPSRCPLVVRCVPTLCSTLSVNALPL